MFQIVLHCGCLVPSTWSRRDNRLSCKLLSEVFICVFSIRTMTTYTYNVTGSGTYSCSSSATQADTCVFTCTEEDLDPSATIQCNNAGTCHIECGAQKCLKGSTIYADSELTRDLIITAEGKECMKATTTYLPNGGNATISIVDTGDEKEFKEATFIATQNTDHIWINCSVSSPDDNCYELTINASTAKYLEINGDSSDMEKTVNESIYLSISKSNNKH